MVIRNDMMNFKLSYAISVSRTDFKAVGKGDWRSLISSSGLMGYDGVELAVRNPDEVSLSSVREALDSSGLVLSAVGTGQAFLSDRLSLSNKDAQVRRNALNRVIRYMEFARVFGAKVIIGLIRGGVEEESRRQKRHRLLLESLKILSDKAEFMDVNLLIEPINRYETDLIPTLESAAELIEETGCNKMQILTDTFHMNIEEKDMCGTIEKYGHIIGHVHLADSNRMAPGKGHIDFEKILESLQKVNYKGFLSFEILPIPSVEQAAQEALKYTADIIKAKFLKRRYKIHEKVF